ncbi:MAG: Lrp/AsnC family transcriptional regulator [Candidatus Hodarchaeales archaeon]|jgi:DNA-binding Lrp family transcriptional regulator
MLDDKNREIVEFFKRNPRSSFNNAAKELNLAKATVKRRYEILVEKGYINILLTANASKLDFSHALSFIEITNPTTEKAILTHFGKCPMATTMFALSGFEYNLVICLLSKNREDIVKFMDVFPLSRLDGVKRRNTFFMKESEGFVNRPFWIPLSTNEEKPFFGNPSCQLKCETCPIVNEIEKKFISQI